MQQLYTILFSMMAFSAIAQKHIVPEPFRAPGTFHPMPLSYTGQVPDIYLAGEIVKKEHVKTHIVQIVSFRNGDNNYLIEVLKNKAQSEGIDGLFIQQMPTITPLEYGFSYALSGVGLKYLDNLNYLDTILKQRVITQYLPNGKQGKTTLLDFDWHGNLLTPLNSEDVDFYANYMSMLDMHLLFHRLAPMHDYRNMGGVAVERIESRDNWPSKIVHKITGDILHIESILSSSKSSTQPGKGDKVKITPVFTGPRLTGAVVAARDKKETPLYYLHYKYDALGRITNERWEKLIEGKRTLWLEVENRFFEADSTLVKKLARGN